MKHTRFYGAEKIANAPIKEISLEKVKLDPNNVRFLHLPKRLSDKEIEEILWKEADTFELYKQILSAGELYEKPLLNSELTVIEGNRRIVCLRRLRIEANKGDLSGISKQHFDRVRCIVLSKDTPLQSIDILLATIHVKGKKPWNAFNKTKHIFNLYDVHGLSYDDLSKELGMGKKTVMRAVKVYKATEEYGKKYDKDEEWFRKFTYFDELYKRRDLEEFRKEKKNLKKFENWIFHKKLDDVREVRKLGLFLQDKEVVIEFEEKGFDAAMEMIGQRDPSLNSSEFKKIKNTIDVIRNFSRKELSKTVNDSSRLKLLNSLKKEINSLIKDINSMGKTS
ncbi:hypothetical protein KAI04_02970 [Candidatus Pacearchaeota archaeon]|nr:hypothetical protein [Candidatus Pacearchaeota archaeon]